MKHVMLDLETLGTGPDAVVKSIGAVDFDPDTGIIGDDGLHLICSLSGEDLKRGTVTLSTIEWWLKQEGASKDIFTPRWDDIPLTICLAMFQRWWSSKQAKYVWGYGANFDPVILGHHFQTIGLNTPWSYSNIRCARTMLAVTGISLKDYPNEIKHNALFDASTQTTALIDAFKVLKGVE